MAAPAGRVRGVGIGRRRRDSGTISASGPLDSLRIRTGVPTNAGSGRTISVTTLRRKATNGATRAPTATTVAYAVADSYPGGALPVSPFRTALRDLAAGCSGAIPEPDV